MSLVLFSNASICRCMLATSFEGCCCRRADVEGWLCSLELGVLLVSCCLAGLFFFLRLGGVPASSVDVDETDSESDDPGDDDADVSVELESSSYPSLFRVTPGSDDDERDESSPKVRVPAARAAASSLSTFLIALVSS